MKYLKIINYELYYILFIINYIQIDNDLSFLFSKFIHF